MKRLYRALRDIAFGLHSGIPLCCVLAFVRDDWQGKHLVASRRKKALGYKVMHSPWSYAPCWRCAGEIKLGERTPAVVCDCRKCERLSCAFWSWRTSRPVRVRPAR